MSKRGAARLRKVERCESCGRRMRRETVERYQYAESGLSNVYLHGIVRYVCDCGETVVGLHNVERLHDLIFCRVLMKRGPLSGEELRFLRKYMGLKGADFANMVRVDPTTLSKWENGLSIGEQSDKLIRLAVGLAMTSEVKKAVETAYRQVADKYLDFLNGINLETTAQQDQPEGQMTFDITAEDLLEQDSELSFRWGLSQSPTVELAEK